LNELGIEWIAAHSPQAKGRIERCPQRSVAAIWLILDFETLGARAQEVSQNSLRPEADKETR